MAAELPPRLPLALTPTPLEFAPRLTEAWGGPKIWLKRDDLSGFGLSGNKVRKIEFHLAAAQEAGADTIITCGATQSNHARATALACAQVGLRCVLVLRSPDAAGEALTGNYLLDLLAGADVRFITPAAWDKRDDIMAAEAEDQLSTGHRSWIIPEGASDPLGMWGFVIAMREVADQVVAIPGRAPVLWHAASSGGTTAGIGWALDRLGLDLPVVACSIGDDKGVLEAKVQSIWAGAAAATKSKPPAVSIEFNDRHIGGGYGIVTDREMATQAEATRLTGMILDPTYTGKAIAGLRREIDEGRFGAKDNVVFWHTGGGFAVFAHDFSRTASAAARGGSTA